MAALFSRQPPYSRMGYPEGAGDIGMGIASVYSG
jgi:hypothetical protein